MANVPVTVRTYAEGLEQPRGRIALMARTLRETDATLLPHDPVGRNLSTDLLPNHLINLLLGVAVGDPITNVTHLVRTYRDAVWVQPLDEIWDEVKPRKPLLGGLTLGADLDELIDCSVRPLGDQRRSSLAQGRRLQVRLVVGEALLAEVEDLDTGQVDSYKPHDPSLVGGKTFRLLGRDYPTEQFRRWAYLETAHLEIAAALWGDSLKRGAIYPSLLDDPSNDGSAEISAANKIKHAKALVRGEKNAGNLHQEAPAPISDQPRANETGGFTALPEAIREDHDLQGKPRCRQVAPSRKKKEQTDA